MGIGRIATWFALFALLANAGSGLGLEQARPDTSWDVATICTTQAAINTLMQPDDATTEVDVCALQTHLGSTALPHESTVRAESDSLLLAVLCASPELLAPAMMRSALPFDDREVESASCHEATQVVAGLAPPESLPLEHARHTLRTPNGPPVTA